MNNIETLRLLRKTMDKHGLHDWSSRLDNSTKRFGACWYIRKRISISRYLAELNDYETVLETILHEIAHALCPPRVHHGKIWKDKCVEIGALPERTYDSQTVNVPKGRYSGKCPLCPSTFQRTRKPKRKLYCKCDKRRWINPIRWTDNQTGELYHKEPIRLQEGLVIHFPKENLSKDFVIG
jgi:predicted SprT family Zn-dependent metalloprotease